MTAYVDTSALLRLVLREPGALEELRSCDALVSSELTAVESARTIDRLRLQGTLTVEEAADRLRAVTGWLEAIDLVLLRPPVLSRASEPLPTSLGTLDAVHLATALIWRERMGALSMIATHDTALGLAARTFGFDVRGVWETTRGIRLEKRKHRRLPVIRTTAAHLRRRPAGLRGPVHARRTLDCGAKVLAFGLQPGGPTSERVRGLRTSPQMTRPIRCPRATCCRAFASVIDARIGRSGLTSRPTVPSASKEIFSTF